MNQDVIHVYFMPGMAASPKIFEYIKLPAKVFKLHFLQWIQPTKDESLNAYAQRMAQFVTHDKVVLLGVSFGGILIQEMSKFLSVRKLIVVSSVKTKYELPRRMKLAKLTGAYKLLPTSWASKIDFFGKLAVGETANKRLELYKRYLSVNDKNYLDWAIKQVVSWQQETPHPKAIYIHGSHDGVFTHSCQGNCIVVEGGTHIMIINRYKWFNKHLPELILG